MNKIYTIMVMTDLTYNEQTKCPEFCSSRLVGWEPDFNRANEDVMFNVMDINETCYKYALIEECYWGLYHPASKRWWYEYNKDKDEYIPIDEPDFINGFCGFTIG